MAPAQVTTSNLAGSFGGYYSITLNNWQEVRFTTDANAYTLDSVTLDMGSPLDASGSFMVRVHADSSNHPGTLLETLSGSANPSGAVSYTSSGLSLAPNTYYHIVVGVTAGAGDYQWVATGPGNTGPFAFNYGFGSSADQGATWPSGTAVAMKYAVTVTPIPEPSTYAALLGAAGLGLVAWRRRTTSSRIRPGE